MLVYQILSHGIACHIIDLFPAEILVLVSVLVSVAVAAPPTIVNIVVAVVVVVVFFADVISALIIVVSISFSARWSP